MTRDKSSEEYLNVIKNFFFFFKELVRESTGQGNTLYLVFMKQMKLWTVRSRWELDLMLVATITSDSRLKQKEMWNKTQL